jgi:hypothetical protein
LGHFVGLVTVLQKSSSSSGSGSALPVILAIALVVFALYRRSVDTSRPGQGPLFLNCSPIECIDAVTGFLVQRGFAIAYRSDTAATFTRPKKADTELGCILLLLGLIPGLLYFGLFKGTLTTTVTALRSDTRTTQLVFSGDDLRTQAELTRWTRENLAVSDET